MTLHIEFIGSEIEKVYMQRLIYPNKNDGRSICHCFLDYLIQCDNDTSTNDQLEPNLDIPVVMEFLKEAPNKCYKYNDSGIFDNIPIFYIRRLIFSNSIDDRLIFSISPKESKISFNAGFRKAKVFSEDENSILFGYAIDERHISDIPIVVKMFYHPKI